VSETVDLRTPEEASWLRHFLRMALNTIVGYADVVRRQAKVQGARAEADIMREAAAAGREAIQIVNHLLPIKSHIPDSAIPMLRRHLLPHLERIGKALASFQAASRGACPNETGKMRLALQDLAEFVEGKGPAPPPSGIYSAE
jgi:hypothetical protein